jgi:hypothetical protein
MENLKLLIEQYGRWQPLNEYILRVEAHIHSDFGLALENAKSILESIAKEICQEKEIELVGTESVASALKKAFKGIGYSGKTLETQLSTSIANIGQQMGNLRTEIGTVSHGKTMSELKNRNDGIDELTKEFAINSTELTACFLIRAYENENPRVKHNIEQINYEQEEEFNEFWDEMYGEFSMTEDYTYPASEILYNIDYSAYKTEHTNFIDTERDNDDE